MMRLQCCTIKKNCCFCCFVVWYDRNAPYLWCTHDSRIHLTLYVRDSQNKYLCHLHLCVGLFLCSLNSSGAFWLCRTFDFFKILAFYWHFHLCVCNILSQPSTKPGNFSRNKHLVNWFGVLNKYESLYWHGESCDAPSSCWLMRDCLVWTYVWCVRVSWRGALLFPPFYDIFSFSGQLPLFWYVISAKTPILS